MEGFGREIFDNAVVAAKVYRFCCLRPSETVERLWLSGVYNGFWKVYNQVTSNERAYGGDGLQLFMDGLILAVLSAAVWLDFDAWRIPNGLIIFGTAAGAGLNFYLTRLFGLADAFAGFLIPFILLLPLYGLSMLGAGDIKLLMAAGAFTGWRGSLFSLAAAAFAGAALSITLMIKHRNFLKRFHFFFHYIIQIKSRHCIQPYYSLKNPQRGETVHFSLCIAIGVCAYLIARGGVV